MEARCFGLSFDPSNGAISRSFGRKNCNRHTIYLFVSDDGVLVGSSSERLTSPCRAHRPWQSSMPPPTRAMHDQHCKHRFDKRKTSHGSRKSRALFPLSRREGWGEGNARCHSFQKILISSRLPHSATESEGASHSPSPHPLPEGEG